MKGTTIAVSLLLLMPWLAMPLLAEAPPDYVNYQGVLRDAAGVPLDGTHDMVFRYFNAETAGAEIMVERHTAAAGNPVTVAGGLFNVHLGSGVLEDGSGGGTYTNLPRVFRYHTDVWLSVEVGGELLDPRVRIVASPYAHNSDFLDGYSSSYFLNTGAGTQEKTGLILATGGVDYGPGADDDLAAADVEALTAGGSADSLHSHASVGGSDTLDGLDSSQFLRSDTSDSFDSGTLTVGGAATLEVAGASVLNQLAVNANSIELNHDGPDGTFSVNFFDGGSPYGEYLQWVPSMNRFSFSKSVHTDATMIANRFQDRYSANYYLEPAGTSTLHDLDLTHYSLSIKSDGPDGPAYIHFYDDGIEGNEYLLWYDSEDRFQFSNDLYVNGVATAAAFLGVSDPVYFVQPDGSDGSAYLAGNIIIGGESSTDDDEIVFDDGSRVLKWWDAGDQFAFNNDLWVTGALTASSLVDAENSDYFANPSTYSTLWGIRLNGTNLYLNFDGPDGENTIYFYDGGSSTGEYLQWDASYDRFVLTDDVFITDAYNGVLAYGSNSGGYFLDSDSSGFGRIGYGNYGGYMEGDYIGVRGRDIDHGSYGYVGYETYTLYGTGVKSFVQNHPYAADQIVVYGAPEGGEAATYTRGTARLENGEARVPLEETFRWVTNPDIGLTAHLTPRGQDANLFVESVSTEELVVRASADSPPDAVFDYMVWGLRIGFEEIGIVREKGVEEARIPSMNSHREARDKHPEWDRYVPLERFMQMREAIGESAEVDLSASLALRDAIGEYDHSIHGTPREEPQGGSVLPEIDEPDESPPPGGGEGGGEGDESVFVMGPPLEDGPTLTEGAGESGTQRSPADLTQDHPVGEPVTSGDVLVADPDRPGVLRLGHEMADPAVVGIVVDAAPQEHASIALPGTVVLCKIDAGYGSVRVGDLLMTSPTPGHAMRADDPLPGTIVGKALEPLDVNTGLIRVIVMLR